MIPAIRIENLGKRYVVDHESRQRGGYRTLRESLVEMAQAPLRRLRGHKRTTHEDFWALKDVSFEVQPGDVVGIIGRNGAGKSTLLKILSQITKPTTGRVELRGRVGSLLEVGTGFHPELTGRENIYLNGSILGMSKREIDHKFDEIVDFGEIEQFLDTPVKRYSSGMYVRLAFAVAAHLEPEILIIDEVLAVGDATFQKRCLDRISALARSGATILLVSHNLEILPIVCKSALLLQKGTIEKTGKAADIVDYYIDGQRSENAGDLSISSRRGNGSARFLKLQLLNGERFPISSHVSGDDLIVRMEIRSSRDLADVAVAVVLQNLRGMRLVTSWTKEVGFQVNLEHGLQTIVCRFHQVRLRPGHQFSVSLWMAATDVIDDVENVQVVPVLSSEQSEHFSPSRDHGPLLCHHTWTFLKGQKA